MFFQKIESKGLAHFSYLVGDDGMAFVIDPMRDIQIYIDIANENGLIITDIFETHRNEDYISGSLELSTLTGADIHISGHEDLDYKFGERIYDGDNLEFGELTLKALYTPGHTLGHLSYVLYESNRSNPFILFSGDSLFMGDLGRTDFYGEENLEKMTGLLYDSIFEKIFSLGDDVILMPAHGAGSACGASIEDRPYSTIGYERLNNPLLQINSKDEFIKKFAKIRIKPRYFDEIEKYNVNGAKFVGATEKLIPFYYDEINDDDIIIDLRSVDAYCGGHIPGAIYLNLGILTSFLGTFLDSEENIILLAEENDIETIKTAYWHGTRIGFDNIIGFLSEGMTEFYTSGNIAEKLNTIGAKEYLEIEDKIVLDVRDVENLDEIGKQENYYKIPVKILHEKYDLLPEDREIYVICNSGNTATAACSFLLRKGYNVNLVLGGIKAIDSLLNKF